MTTVQKKEKGLQKYSFRGYTPDQINEFTTEQIVELFRARQRRRFARSNYHHLSLEIKHKYNRLYMKCKKAKKNCAAGDKPAVVKTHLRNAIVMPEMVGNIVGVYNGKTFNAV
jgi:small subunit ribosomal protein S15e